MAGHRIVVIGASAGGVEAMTQLVKHFPAGLDAAVFISMHFPAYSVSMLPDILNRADGLKAKHPQQGEAIQPGYLYISPPDYHLLIHTDTIELSRGPKENGHRPAIDPMFRSAAKAYGSEVVGVILTGMLDDGTAGLRAIKSEGGMALVQDPEEAFFKGMPKSAIANVAVDKVLPLNDLADEIAKLVADAVGDPAMTSHNLEYENKIVTQEKAAAENGKRPNAASPLTCPDCGGVLWELRDNSLLRYRCHVGHAYSLDSLLVEQTETLERALWTAVRAMEEKATLSRRLAAQAKSQNRSRSAEQFAQQAEETEQNVRLVRQMIEHQQYLRANGSEGDTGTEEIA
jgi:two-component system chemotaxis response regulator CheB